MEKFLSTVPPRSGLPGRTYELSDIVNLSAAGFIASLIFISSGPALANNKTAKTSKFPSTQTEHLAVSGVEYDGSTLTFNAISNGCTRPDHFSARHEYRDGQCHVEIYRTKPDYCRAAPRPVKISTAWALPGSCKSGNLVLTNRLLLQSAKAINPQKQEPVKQKNPSLPEEKTGRQNKQ